MRRRLVFDTSAILNFGHRSGETTPGGVILERFRQENDLLIPPEVRTETLREPPDHFDYHAFLSRHFSLRVGHPPARQAKEVSRLAGFLGSGELAVLVLGLEQGATVVIDERIARREADRLGVSCVGTVGLLNEAVQTGWISGESALDLVRSVIRHKGRLPPVNQAREWREYWDSIR